MHPTPNDAGSSRSRALALTLLVCVAVGGGYAWWRDGGKRLFQPRNWGVVEQDWLYRSGQIHPRLIEDVLRDHRIDVVIDLARDDPRAREAQAEEEATRALGIRKVDLWGLNGSGVGKIEAYGEALEEIARARTSGERVLVHCSAGSERTGGVIALYRMLFEGWSGEDAYREYLSYRNRPPEPGKKDKLSRFLNQNMQKVVAHLVQAGALASPPVELPVFGPGERSGS